jgi:hypothetical protein
MDEGDFGVMWETALRFFKYHILHHFGPLKVEWHDKDRGYI